MDRPVFGALAEAWKYGERAFRYCQLDIGHALGALRYAAGTLGWKAKVVENLGCVELTTLMGLDRPKSFPVWNMKIAIS